MTFLSWMERILVALICTISCRYFLHMFQLESYQLDGYKRWLNKNREALLGFSLTVGVSLTVGKLLLQLLLINVMGSERSDMVSVICTLVALVAFAYVAMKLYQSQRNQPEKKPLAFTARMKRLYVCVFLVALVVCSLISYLGIPPYVLFIALSYLVMIAGYVMQPIERQISKSFMDEAEEILEQRPDLIKIGITGSYGKTSTKFILQTILAEKYDVLATPSSFNTPMGLTRVIREQLEQHHQVFLAEMGARHVGDIQELCDLVKPKYGVLTSVGAQHLETFGAIETVANTKFELIENLPEDGVAFFGGDNGGWCDKLYERATCEKYRTGIDGGFLSMYAEDITVSPEGSRFVLCDAEGGRAQCHTRMLGRHNIENIVLACSVAKRLGLPLPQIAAGVNKTQPVEHRLQLINNPNGITVIDDAFNSNPVGAQAALDVLRSFPGRRVLVTPGMVEQGEQEQAINKAFGQQIPGSCDVLILIGKKHTRPIAEGALAAGFDPDQLHVVANLDEATVLLGQLGRPGDAVLFENDLPDNYNES